MEPIQEALDILQGKEDMYIGYLIPVLLTVQTNSPKKTFGIEDKSLFKLG